MKLNVHVGDNSYPFDVSDDMLVEAEEIYAKMDADMNKGWQMYRDWVVNLTNFQRCQVVGDKLLTALENESEPSSMLMAGYIMTRMPDISSIHLSTDGDITQTQMD